MKTFFLGSICFYLTACTFGSLDGQIASAKIDMALQTEYARYVIRKQADGAKEILVFDKWLDGEYKDLSDYGKYYDICKQYPESNKGGPLDYKDWVKANPRPIAKESFLLSK